MRLLPIALATTLSVLSLAQSRNLPTVDLGYEIHQAISFNVGKLITAKGGWAN